MSLLRLVINQLFLEGPASAFCTEPGTQGDLSLGLCGEVCTAHSRAEDDMSALGPSLAPEASTLRGSMARALPGAQAMQAHHQQQCRSSLLEDL